MKILWHPLAWEDYQYWVASDAKVHRRINDLLKECQRTPFKGTGKPEPLKGDFKGWRSRRITGEDRLVYRVEGKAGDQVLVIAQCRFHY